MFVLRGVRTVVLVLTYIMRVGAWAYVRRGYVLCIVSVGCALGMATLFVVLPAFVVLLRSSIGGTLIGDDLFLCGLVFWRGAGVLLAFWG